MTTPTDSYRKSFQAWNAMIDERAERLIALARRKGADRSQPALPDFIRAYLRHR